VAWTSKAARAAADHSYAGAACSQAAPAVIEFCLSGTVQMSLIVVAYVY